MQIAYFKVMRENKEEKIEKEKKICGGLLMFLEEVESISIMNAGLSEKKSKGRPEDGGMEDGGWRMGRWRR